MVLGLVSALAVTLSMGVRRVRNSDLRADITRIAQALRSAYGMAAYTGKHHRVVFDLDERTFRIEVCEGNVKLYRERREQRGGDDVDEARVQRALEFLQGDPNAQPPGLTGEFVPQVQQAMTPEQAADKARALAGARVGAGECGPPTRMRGGKQVPDPRGKPQRLTRDDVFKAIWVQHLDGPVEREGTVSIHFFPLGHAEKAVVQVADGTGADADFYTLVVHGLTGRVEFRDGDWIDPEDHMMRDAEGKRAEGDR